MTDEHPDIIQRGRCYVLAHGKGGTGVPYRASGPRADGTQNHGYKALAQNPGAIDDIPELGPHPAFKALVGFINFKTPFETYGCETYARPYDGPAGESAPTQIMSSYFNFGLKNHEANFREIILRMAQDFVALLDRREIPWVQFEFEVEPDRFEGRDGYMLLVRTTGYGLDAEQAYRIWAAAQGWLLVTFIDMIDSWPRRGEGLNLRSGP